MGFWDDVSIFNYIKSLFSTSYFTPSIINKSAIVKSPTNSTYKFATEKDLPKIAAFLKAYFGSPPKTPVLDIPIQHLLNKNDIILYVSDKSNNIIGCIRSHYIGKFYTADNKPDMYITDCFCIHPTWRKHGVGQYLLHSLHTYTASQKKYFALCLKEGMPISTFLLPFHSGLYTYKQLTLASRIPITHTMTVNNSAHIEQLINTFRAFNKDIFIIWNKDDIQNQIWRFFKRGCNMILACFQDTHQIKYNNITHKYDKIAWCTAWYESDNIPDNIRSLAINELIAWLYPDFQYVWMNKDITGSEPGWIVDGSYHWYLYQWFTKSRITKNFCITT